MSRPTDQSDQPTTVPPRELNPLVNPLLAKNMGRWAEVYFTAPPEKRDQAVTDLLRELEGGESAQHERETRQTHVAAVSSEPHSDPSTSAPTEADVVCRACGHDNPPTQKFCGMCGATLQREAPTDTEPIVSDGLRFLPPENVTPERVDGRAEEPSSNEDRPEPVPKPYPTYAQEVGFRDDAFLLDSARPSFAYSYRMFIGTALAIVIVTLAYMAWRSGQAASLLSQQAPQAPPASTVQPTAPAHASPNAVAPAKPEDPEADSSVKGDATPPAQDGAKASKETDTARPPIRSARPAPRPATLVEKTSELSPRGNGSEELAIAQRYLNPSDGQKRDSAAAAEWLWKAVAKRNGEATILLSDLYLRGAGIQKNCDQARVLLRAAAQNGRKDAAERLRHMQAFGCE